MKIKFFLPSPSIGLPGYHPASDIKNALSAIATRFNNRLSASETDMEINFGDSALEIDLPNLVKIFANSTSDEKTIMHELLNNLFLKGSIQLQKSQGILATTPELCMAIPTLLQFLYPESRSMDAGTKSKYLGDIFIQFNKIPPILVVCATITTPAVAMDTILSIKGFFKDSFNINSPDATGMTPLHWASFHSLDIVKFLLENGANPKIPDNSRSLPAHYAAREGKLDIFKHFVEEAEFGINLGIADGRTAAYFAAAKGHTDIISYIADKYKATLGINSFNDMGITLLNLTSVFGTLDMVKYLLENGADPTIVDASGSLPAHYAAREGKLDIFNHFVKETGFNINLGISDGRTSAHFAAVNGRSDIIKYIKANGGNVNIPTHNGMTPLHYVSCLDSLDMVKCLLENGADPTIVDVSGSLAAHYAAREGKLDIFNHFVEVTKFPINSQTITGMTAGHYACSNTNLSKSQIHDMLKSIAAHGGSFSIEDHCGRSYKTILQDRGMSDFPEWFTTRESLDIQAATGAAEAAEKAIHSELDGLDALFDALHPHDTAVHGGEAGADTDGTHGLGGATSAEID